MKSRNTLALVALALVACWFGVRSGWSAIEIPVPETKTVTTDKWYVETIVVELDAKEIRIVIQRGTGDGDAFVRTKNPISLTFKDDATATPAKTDYTDLMGAIQTAPPQGKTPYEALFELIVTKVTAAGVLEQP